MFVRRVPSNQPWSSPWEGLEEMRRELGRMFDTWGEGTGLPSTGVFPPIEVFEETDEIKLRAEVPGIKAQDLDVRVENQTLTISGERKPPGELERSSVHRREREWGRFRRSFSLPVSIDAANVQARTHNGILIIHLPKAVEARPNQITVQSGS